MELKEFVANFADVFDDTDVSLITPETRFRDLDEWSSIIGLSVISMIDDEYGVVLKGNSLRKCDTVSELFEMVKSLQ